MNKELLSKKNIEFSEVEELSYETAAKMVKNYHDSVGADTLQPFFINKEAIAKILSQPGCVGLYLADAIDQNGEKMLVFSGYDLKGNVLQSTQVNSDGKLAVIKCTNGVHPKEIEIWWIS